MKSKRMFLQHKAVINNHDGKACWFTTGYNKKSNFTRSKPQTSLASPFCLLKSMHISRNRKERIFVSSVHGKILQNKESLLLFEARSLHSHWPTHVHHDLASLGRRILDFQQTEHRNATGNHTHTHNTQSLLHRMPTSNSPPFVSACLFTHYIRFQFVLFHLTTFLRLCFDFFFVFLHSFNSFNGVRNAFESPQPLKDLLGKNPLFGKLNVCVFFLFWGNRKTEHSCLKTVRDAQIQFY